jgi:hypothetical protein
MPAMLRQIASVLDDMQAKHRFLASQPGRVLPRGLRGRAIAEVEEEAAAILALLRDRERRRSRG